MTVSTITKNQIKYCSARQTRRHTLTAIRFNQSDDLFF